MVGASVEWGLAVGGSLVLGAVLAARFRLPGKLAAIATAFGGGLLLAAVALELVPEADERAGLWPTAAGLLAGMLAYVAGDFALTSHQEIAMLRRSAHAAAAGRPMPMQGSGDIARGESTSRTLLVGIIAGNVVEAYGAAQPILAGGRSKRFAVGLLGAIGVVLAGATLFGTTVLADWSDSVVGIAQAVAAGAVLAVVTIAIVPYVFDEASRWVAVASVGGFVVGFLL